MSKCGMELCPAWTGDGCICDLMEIDDHTCDEFCHNCREWNEF